MQRRKVTIIAGGFCHALYTANRSSRLRFPILSYCTRDVSAEPCLTASYRWRYIPQARCACNSGLQQLWSGWVFGQRDLCHSATVTGKSDLLIPLYIVFLLLPSQIVQSFVALPKSIGECLRRCWNTMILPA